MREIAPPDCDFAWLPVASAGLTRPSAGDHKILCQVAKLFPMGRCVKNFLMEKTRE